LKPSSRKPQQRQQGCGAIDRIDQLATSPGGPLMRSIAVLITAAAVCLVVPVAAQQPSTPAFEKKEFTHSAWTKGIFSEAVTVKGFGRGTMVFLAGVGAEDENGPRGNIRHHNDLVAQCDYAFDKIKRVLAAHGANMNHVVKVTSYLTDMKNRVPYGQCLGRNFGTAPLPVHTLIGVTSLAFPEMMVETDVTAITPD
jgi:enamine deaminase RidA (YjgF/YER057c/UK114 family)